MIGEREDIHQDSNYGSLFVRAFNIDGNEINAFYDAQNNLVFVLDNTINAQKPNVLLVINPDGDKKWDEILSTEYNVDLETVRPKVDNKYQKLDIEYSGLSVYEGLINAYNAGDGLGEHLNQLAILRDSAARHSAMTRLNAANETISKTNATIVKTKESIVRLENRIKTLRSKLSAAKKEIGKVNTKQSASKILKLESQIEASNEKLKRAKKRLESAQKRLETATVDAELASDLLNQPSTEIKEVVKTKPVVVAPEYPVQTVPADDENEEENNTEIKPLFEEDPHILNDDIAFKPISFEAPVFNEIQTEEEKPVVESYEESKSESVLNSIVPIEETEIVNEKPIIESFAPIENIPEPVMEEETEIIEEKPVIETMTPIVQEEPVVAPIEQPITSVEAKEGHSRPGFIYYVLLLVLILLSVFTLWLYQKNMPNDIKPVLTAKTVETVITEPEKEAEKVNVTVANEENEPLFLDEEPVEQKTESKTEVTEPVEEEQDEEPIAEPVVDQDFDFVEEDAEPVVMDVVPSRLNKSGESTDEESSLLTEEEILATKPVYEPGAKHDNMFVNDTGYDSDYYDEYDDYFDEEEAAYQQELDY